VLELFGQTAQAQRLFKGFFAKSPNALLIPQVLLVHVCKNIFVISVCAIYKTHFELSSKIDH
jgi:hypothetical protein